MLFPFQKITLQTSFSGEQVLDKLRAAVFSPRTFAFPSPQEFPEIVRKPFVGKIHDRNFKILLRGDIGRKINYSRGLVIITGEVDGSAIRMVLRPPWFHAVFVALWCAFSGSVFALSFYGPANDLRIHLLIAGIFLLPLAVMLPLFSNEAKLVRKKLEQIFGQDLT